MLSLEEYRRISSEKRATFSEAFERWRASVDLRDINVGDNDFADLRDKSQGRELTW